MGARVKMSPSPRALTSEMLLLIEAQADGAEVFTLPGDVVTQMAQLARRGLAVASPAETPGPASRRVMTAEIDLEKLALWEAARSTVRFLSSEQREALKRALAQ